jgi:uncharacterized membrane protein YkgB
MIDQLIRHRTRMLVISIGIVYLWFGALKFFPGLSPAEALAKETLDKLTLGLVPTHITYFMLASWEVTIGLCMMLNFRKKIVIYITMLHLAFTFTPLFLLPATSFNQQVYSLTLVGQYIIKNLILFTALLFLMEKKSAKKSPILY